MVYEDMKQRYGSQGCYLLKINTRTISAEDGEQIPDPWSQYLHRNNLPNQVSTVAFFKCSSCNGPLWSATVDMGKVRPVDYFDPGHDILKEKLN